jgi:hypothetical protein
VGLVLERAAQLLGLPQDELAQTTTDNLRRLIGLS